MDKGSLAKFDLTVVCFFWGLWGFPQGMRYVNYLYRSVQMHLKRPHRFVCFTDRHSGIGFDEGIQVIPLTSEEVSWRWNFTKLVAYKPNNELTGQVLVLDLDVLIVGPLDDLVDYDGGFATCEAAYHKGRTGGSITSFKVGCERCYENLWKPMTDDRQRIFFEKMLDGSERKYFDMRLRRHGYKVDFWQDLYPGQVLSYKVNCQGATVIPDNARIIRFHGKPRPHEAQEKWVGENWIREKRV